MFITIGDKKAMILPYSVTFEVRTDLCVLISICKCRKNNNVGNCFSFSMKYWNLHWIILSYYEFIVETFSCTSKMKINGSVSCIIPDSNVQSNYLVTPFIWDVYSVLCYIIQIKPTTCIYKKIFRTFLSPIWALKNIMNMQYWAYDYQHVFHGMKALLFTY